ncbi:hypothetical protein BDZ91DRAFT_473161 [Kalaharituber pfeilii]|nr:hypothetical protein BDZ91DRAFT_473161 [Kalaharituber pfeilii]
MNSMQEFIYSLLLVILHPGTWAICGKRTTGKSYAGNRQRKRKTKEKQKHRYSIDGYIGKLDKDMIKVGEIFFFFFFFSYFMWVHLCVGVKAIL